MGSAQISFLDMLPFTETGNTGVWVGWGRDRALNHCIIFWNSRKIYQQK